ncbi:protein kinase domain-containing protein [Hymenobacter cellulosilyticus]|uniref:Protein kinase n=1 Tax=Hymenobacter cellulosilyticus TaxID=2932248 RepID=A0A8T9Q0R5_9BACT|nr:protein kinase [Hymenobacter cellulosilyticus]UOQ69991.1 protein kinase [Hymenobacter cellulosilyticus]
MLELIPPEFRILAGPPSFETCTRDVYAPGTRFSLETTLRIARGVASAVAHLHQRGILHGDLYAHNILTSPTGAARLSDFGAASFFDPATAVGAGLQRLEVRAFGCLLEELLAHCEAAEADAEAIRKLRELQQRCVSPLGEARPLLAEIERELAKV